MLHHVAGMCVGAGVGNNKFDGADLSFDGSLMLSPNDFVGKRIPLNDGADGSLIFEYEHVPLLHPGLDWIALQPIEFMLVEHWVDLTRWYGREPKTDKPQGGTLDLGWVDKTRRRTVWDWKFGQEPVEVFDNWQLQSYDLGFHFLLDSWGIETEDVRFAIEQPRVAGGGDFWYTTDDDVEQFADWIFSCATAVHDAWHMPRPEDYNPGLKQCRWCLARENQTCKAYTQFMLKHLGDLMPDIVEHGELGITDPKLPALDVEQRAVVLKHKAAISAWMEDLHAMATRDAMLGIATPGHKLIRGRAGDREWRSEKFIVPKLQELVALDVVEDMYQPRKLASPAQIEKQVGKKIFERDFKGLVDQSEGKLVLVDENDKHDAVQPAINRMPDIDERVPDADVSPKSPGKYYIQGKGFVDTFDDDDIPF